MKALGLIIALAVLPAWADDACPGATEWSNHHPAPAVAPAAAVAQPELLKALTERVERDQTARKKWLADQDNEALATAVDVIDADNLAWLRKLVTSSGFPSAAQVGKQGVRLAWVLLQHADQDPELQSSLLPVIQKRFDAGELEANDLARLTDRVLEKEGKPQKFGTQFDWMADDFELPPPAQRALIDVERARLGLMPLADYACTLRQVREKNRR